MAALRTFVPRRIWNTSPVLRLPPRRRMIGCLTMVLLQANVSSQTLALASRPTYILPSFRPQWSNPPRSSADDHPPPPIHVESSRRTEKKTGFNSTTMPSSSRKRPNNGGMSHLSAAVSSNRRINSRSSSCATILWARRPDNATEEKEDVLQSDAVYEVVGGTEGENSTVVGWSKSRTILLGTALGCYALAVVMAKLDLLGERYSDEFILRDFGASVLCAILAILFVKVCTFLAANGTLESRDSRKIIHTLSAPLFMILWPLFSNIWGARIFAAVVPLLMSIRLYLAATGGTTGEEYELAGAVSRSGDTNEALGGPFIYVLILLTAVIFFWRDNLIGIIAVSTMAAGDGLADIVGRRYGKTNQWGLVFGEDNNKSMAGTLAFVTASSLCSIGLTYWFAHTGTIALPLSDFGNTALRIVSISAICSLVELLPIGNDNWTVPLCAAVLSALLLLPLEA